MVAMAHTDHDQIHQDTPCALMTKTPRSSFFQLVVPRPKILTKRPIIRQASIRLGGRAKKKRFLLVIRLLKRIKLKWLKLQYTCMLKRLKSFYLSVVQDLIEAGAKLETIQQRIMMETYYTVPVMGVQFAVAIPSHIEHEPSSKPNQLPIKI